MIYIEKDVTSGQYLVTLEEAQKNGSGLIVDKEAHPTVQLAKLQSIVEAKNIRAVGNNGKASLYISTALQVDFSQNKSKNKKTD